MKVLGLAAPTGKFGAPFLLLGLQLTLTFVDSQIAEFEAYLPQIQNPLIGRPRNQGFSASSASLSVLGGSPSNAPNAPGIRQTTSQHTKEWEK